MWEIRRLKTNVLLSLGVLALTGLAEGQEVIRFKNTMKAPITLLVQPEEANGPANLRLKVGQVLEYPLKNKGFYHLQVVPDDQPNSGNHYPPLDLQAIARKLKGAPLELEGEFALVFDPKTEEASPIRQVVYFDAPHPVVPEAKIRIRAPRVDYPPGLTTDSEPVPTTTSAVISAFVPSNAIVTIDGKRTTSKGTMRHFSSLSLSPGSTYSHQLKVEWTKEDGHHCVETQDVVIHPGAVTRVFFRLPITPSPPIILVPVPLK